MHALKKIIHTKIILILEMKTPTLNLSSNKNKINEVGNEGAGSQANLYEQTSEKPKEKPEKKTEK